MNIFFCRIAQPNFSDPRLPAFLPTNAIQDPNSHFIFK